MAITYNAGTNVITVTGYTEGTPCNFTDIYNADVAGSWGVVTRQCTNQFCFDAGLIIGDASTTTWFVDTDKAVQFNTFNVMNYTSGYYGAIQIKALANCNFGEVQDATTKTGKNGCYLFFNPPSSTYYGMMAHGSGSLRIYDTCIDGLSAYGLGGGANPQHTGAFVIWGSKINLPVIQSTTATADIDRPVINVGRRTNSYCIHYRRPATVTNPTLVGSRNYGALSFGYAGTINVMNPYIRDCTNIAVLWGYVGTYNIINADTDTWTFNHVSPSACVINRKYEFDLKVIDKDNGAINGATVKIWDKDSNLIVDTTTNASGVIATQTITRGTYASATGNTLQEKSPHLIKIEKADYTTYEADFTLGDKTDWIIALQVSGGLLRNPPLTGGMV